MHNVVAGCFGISAVWLLPLLWRICRAVFARGTSLRGRGTIRFWLGLALVLPSSCALEALLGLADGMGDSVPVSGGLLGQTLAPAIRQALGAPAGAGALLALIVLALPWYVGSSWRRLLGRQGAAVPDSNHDAARLAAGSVSPSRTRARTLPTIQHADGVPVPLGRTTHADRLHRPVAPRNSRPATSASSGPKASMASNGAKTGAARTASVHPAKPWQPVSRQAATQRAALPRSPAKPRAAAPEPVTLRLRPDQPLRPPASPSSASPAPSASDHRSNVPRPVSAAMPSSAPPSSGVCTPSSPASTAPPPRPSPSAVTLEVPEVSAALTLGAPSPVTETPSAVPPSVESADSIVEAPKTEMLIEAHEPSACAAGTPEIDKASEAPEMLPAEAIDEPIAPVAGLVRVREAANDHVAGGAPTWGRSAVPTPAAQPTASLGPTMRHVPAVELPGIDLLVPGDAAAEPVSESQLIETGEQIQQRLKEFKVPVTVMGASAGPVITRFEIEPAVGVRGAQIVGLMKDLSRGLGLTSIRVVETIPGKTTMGLELPNPRRQMIRLSDVLASRVYADAMSPLTLALGKDITGAPVAIDLARAPHMLVAGTTGSGKSVAINAMILSLLYKARPDDVRMILIDPKMLELSVYEGIPHLLAPVVTDMKLAANALNWCVGEMEKRYRLMSALGVRNLAGYNQKIRDGERAERKVPNPFSLTPDCPEPLSTLPMIVVVIDELADLMMVAGKKIEELIARLAQKARAAGIHLILATQRPSVDVITGLIKANIPTRIAFQVSSKIDSRTILDQMGAESLLGQGDMLFLPPGSGDPQRVHGAFVDDAEVHRVVEYLKQFGEPEYDEGILSPGVDDGGDGSGAALGDADVEADPLYDEAVAWVLRTRRASISSVQRQFRIGYNRAARLVEQMEAAGLVSSMSVNGSRDVLAPGPAD